MSNTYLPETPLKKHLDGETLSDEEQRTLEEWLSKDEYNRIYFNEITQPGADKALAEGMAGFDPASIEKRLDARLRRPAKVRRMKRLIQVAAAILVAAFAGIYIFRVSTARSVRFDRLAWNAPTSYTRMVLPDGKTINLDSTGAEMLAGYKGLSILRTDSRGIAIGSVGGPGNEEYTGDISISTPSMKRYEVLLPDGTKLWLNASSSVRIPLAYAAKERNIDMQGEVFYKVAPDKQHAFKVNAGNVSVAVLGTSFNVRAYPDERRIQTNVTEGAVSVGLPGGAHKVTPGESLEYFTTQGAFRFTAVKMENVATWRNGILNLTDVTPKDIAEKITKWYGLKAPVFINGADRMGRDGLGTLGIDSSSVQDLLTHLRCPGVKFSFVDSSLHVIRQ